MPRSGAAAGLGRAGRRAIAKRDMFGGGSVDFCAG